LSEPDGYSSVVVRQSSENEGVRKGRRVGVYGWGVVAPGAKNVAALDALLRDDAPVAYYERGAVVRGTVRAVAARLRALTAPGPA
jgi:hypothetical protein